MGPFVILGFEKKGSQKVNFTVKNQVSSWVSNVHMGDWLES
jgi:hypothetical protein